MQDLSRHSDFLLAFLSADHELEDQYRDLFHLGNQSGRFAVIQMAESGEFFEALHGQFFTIRFHTACINEHFRTVLRAA